MLISELRVNMLHLISIVKKIIFCWEMRFFHFLCFLRVHFFSSWLYFLMNRYFLRAKHTTKWKKAKNFQHQYDLNRVFFSVMTFIDIRWIGFRVKETKMLLYLSHPVLKTSKSELKKNNILCEIMDWNGLHLYYFLE